MCKYWSVHCPQLIQAGKGEALRIRAILRSLVPIEDLVGVISLPVQIPTYGKGMLELDGIKMLNITVHQFKVSSFMLLFFLSFGTHFGALLFVLSIDGQIVEPKMSASFVPDHKASMVLFLDRVYGIDNQDFLLHVLEVGFLPDMRATASLDTVSHCLFHDIIKHREAHYCTNRNINRLS